jgi:hypothetical protein
VQASTTTERFVAQEMMKWKLVTLSSPLKNVEDFVNKIGAGTSEEYGTWTS